MNLRSCVDRYIEYRRSLGTAFQSESQVLNLFVKRVGGGVECDAVTREDVVVFLQGNGALTQTRAHRYCILTGFFRYAVSREHVASSPLPAPEDEPRKPAPKPPYIYTREEIRRLVDAIPASRRRAFGFDGPSLRMLICLLYGAGLRSSEARGLRVRDVDLSNSEITIDKSKFYKSRRLPVGAQLAAELRAYAKLRATRPFPERTDSFFLATVHGGGVPGTTVSWAFRRLLHTAEIYHTDPTTRSPCLHSFRHSFAVHRLIAWYRDGQDVQRLLPKLATYLGHAQLVSTQVYLTMTPELLSRASDRYEHYVRGDADA